MGGGYSDLNIYFNSKKGSHEGNGYKVVTTEGIFTGCSDYQVITHTITFSPPENGLKYNILLNDGLSDNSKGIRLFGYYYPSNDKELIDQVRTYYSILDPDSPLVISFQTKTNTYNCYLDCLKNARWDYASNITEYSFGETLEKKHLIDKFKYMTRNRTILFRIGIKNVEMRCIRQEIGSEGFRYICIPDGNVSVMGSESLPFIDGGTTKEESINKIDPYFLKPFNGLVYDGIIIYFLKLSENYIKSSGKDTALLLEFIYSSKSKSWLKRKDKQGHWWTQEKIDYHNEDSLIKELKQINTGLIEVNTIILDRIDTYQGVTKVITQSHKAYTKYTHNFKQPNKTVIIFKREEKKIGNLDSENKIIDVDVYYLNHGGKQDIEPFLIVFFSDGRSPRNRKAYHFSNDYGFTKWKEYIFDENTEGLLDDHLENKLYEKIKKIKEYASCILELGLLRWYTYQILIGKDPDPDEVKKEEEFHRPKVTIPPPKPDRLPIYWIIAGSVGGGVFVISSAALYGVYWYNTTIKLLT